MIAIANTFNPPLSLLGRLKDYYEGQEFFTLELKELKRELLEAYKKSNNELQILLKLALLCDLVLLIFKQQSLTCWGINIIYQSKVRLSK